MIFVAQPYFHLDDEVIKERVKIGAMYCGALLKDGQMCVSPVMFGKTILNHVDLPGDFSFWDKISFDLLEKSDIVHVLTIPGWEKSRGVSAEIERAKLIGLPVVYVSTDNIKSFIEQTQIKSIV